MPTAGAGYAPPIRPQRTISLEAAAPPKDPLPKGKALHDLLSFHTQNNWLQRKLQALKINYRWFYRQAATGGYHLYFRISLKDLDLNTPETTPKCKAQYDKKVASSSWSTRLTSLIGKSSIKDQSPNHHDLNVFECWNRIHKPDKTTYDKRLAECERDTLLNIHYTDLHNDRAKLKYLKHLLDCSGLFETKPLDHSIRHFNNSVLCGYPKTEYTPHLLQTFDTITPEKPSADLSSTKFSGSILPPEPETKPIDSDKTLQPSLNYLYQNVEYLNLPRSGWRSPKPKKRKIQFQVSTTSNPAALPQLLQLAHISLIKALFYKVKVNFERQTVTFTARSTVYPFLNARRQKILAKRTPEPDWEMVPEGGTQMRRK